MNPDISIADDGGVIESETFEGEKDDMYIPPKAEKLQNECPYCSNTSRVNHSKLGVVSFLLSLLSGIGFISLVGYAATHHDDIHNTQLITGLGYITILFVFMSLVSVVTGIFCLIQKRLNKFFGILGTVFSFQFLTILGLVMVFGFYVNN